MTWHDLSDANCMLAMHPSFPLQPWGLQVKIVFLRTVICDIYSSHNRNQESGDQGWVGRCQKGGGVGFAQQL